MRKCPFDGCKRTVDPDKFGCYDHWRQLNGGERSRIWAAYRSFLARKITGEELRTEQAAVLASWRERHP